MIQNKREKERGRERREGEKGASYHIEVWRDGELQLLQDVWML